MQKRSQSESRPELPATQRLPEDVALTRLVAHVDSRGSVAEIFRTSWPTGIVPLQWSVCLSKPGVLRGMHVHARHDDYLCVIEGRLCVALVDLRPGSPTEREHAFLELDGAELSSLLIPHGIAHGFYARDAATYVLGTSHHYDLDDELGVHWADPELGLRYPFESPILSARDQRHDTLAEVLPHIEPWRRK